MNNAVHIIMALVIAVIIIVVAAAGMQLIAKERSSPDPITRYPAAQLYAAPKDDDSWQPGFGWGYSMSSGSYNFGYQFAPGFNF